MSNDINFLRIGVEEPFTKIFELMWDFEKINEQIILAQKGDKLAYQFAIAFYKVAIKEKKHKKLLTIFINDREISDLETQWLRGIEG
ncbi:MAG: hypothetical protein ABIK56_02130 [candidate division WOR-3 bacterium]